MRALATCRAFGLARAGATVDRVVASRWSLRAIIVIFVALGWMTSFMTPLFQGSDESWHYAYVEHYAIGRPVPNLTLHYLGGDPAAPYWQSHEATQPPLYYILMSLATRWIPRGDLTKEVALEGGAPNGMYGNFLTADRGGWGSGHVLAGRIVRLLTVLLAVVAIPAAYSVARQLTGRQDVALFAAAIMGFNPKMIVLSAQVSNDMAVAATSALAFVWITRMALAREPERARLSLWIGLLAGASLLMKYSGAAISIAAGAGLLVHGVRVRLSARQWLAHGAMLGAGFLACTGWYLVHNLQQYGDPLGWNMVLSFNSPFAEPRTLQNTLAWVPFILKSHFGHPTYRLPLPNQYNEAMLYVVLLSMAGVAIMVVRRRFTRGYAPLWAGLAVNLATFYSWMSYHDATQNTRFFSPLFVPITVFFVLGLLEFVPRRTQAGFAVFVSAIYGVFVAGTLAADLPVMYAYPRYLDPGEAAALLQKPGGGRVMFANGIELIDAQLRHTRVNAGDPVELSVVWRATKVLTTSAHLMLDVRDDQDHTIAFLNTGNETRYSYAVRGWQVGELVRESYQLYPRPDHTSVLRILAGWYAHDAPNAPIRPAGSDAVSVEIGRVKVRATGDAPAADDRAALARFTSAADLVSATIDVDALALEWRATGEPERLLKITAYGLDAAGKVVAQEDVLFDYPAVFWSRGERFVQRLTVRGLAQAASVRVGIYDPDTLARVAAQRPDGTGWPDNAAVLR